MSNETVATFKALSLHGMASAWPGCVVTNRPSQLESTSGKSNANNSGVSSDRFTWI